MKSCPFCDILNGRLPGAFVLDEQPGIAVLDIHPLSPGHLLLIPRRHTALVQELTEPERHWLVDRAAQLAEAVTRALPGCQAANLMLNNGRDANQHIPHVHLHIIPRYPRDSLKIGLGFVARMVNLFGRPASFQQLEARAQAIRRQLVRAEGEPRPINSEPE